MAASGRKLPSTPTSTLCTSCVANLYRCIKCRLGYLLRRFYSQKCVVHERKQTPHQFFWELKAGSPGPETLKASIQKTDCPYSHRQNYFCGLHKQGRGMKSGSVCMVWRLLPLCNLRSCPTGSPYPGLIECDGRQTISSQSNYSDRMVFSPSDIQSDLPKVAHTPGRSV